MEDGNAPPPQPPLVSVIVPHYNRITRITNIVETLMSQTFQDWELIIVDDHSEIRPTDTAIPAAARHKAKIIVLDENLGPSGARNVGISIAHGRFVAFLDSDDEWAPEKLALQVAAMLNAPNPDNAICVTRTAAFNGQIIEDVLPRRGMTHGEDPSEYIYMHDGFVQTSSVMVSTAMALRYPFEISLRQFEDHLFFIAIMNAGAQYIYIDMALNYWRDEHAGDRLSKIDLQSFFLSGLKLLSVSEERLTSRARIAFQTRYCGHANMKYNPYGTILLIARAIFLRIISLKYGVWLVARSFTGPRTGRRARLDNDRSHLRQPIQPRGEI